MKKLVLLLASIAIMALSVSSCGSLSNMSQEDAWNIGYGAGTLLRNLAN